MRSQPAVAAVGQQRDVDAGKRLGCAGEMISERNERGRRALAVFHQPLLGPLAALAVAHARTSPVSFIHQCNRQPHTAGGLGSGKFRGKENPAAR